jgi:hypothetical protein
MSGMDIVLAVGQLHFEGNIIPSSWFEHLRRESGKPYTTAIILLSEIVYWYRPKEVRSEATGQVIERRKKFKADKLQRTYDSFANQFGFTKRQVKDAMKFLRDEGIIDLDFRTITTASGTKMGNVLFIGLNVDALREITYGQKKLNQRTPYDEKTSQGIRKNVIGVTEKRQTNTENTTETTTETSGGGVSPVDQDALAALLDIGVTPDQAEKWAAAYKPEDVIGWCEYAKVAGGITNPPGLVVAMLRDGAPPPPRIEVEPEPEPVPRSPLQTEPPEPIPISGTDLNAREVWSHVLEELRMQMTQATFDTWLSGSQVVDVDNGTVTVRVRDGYAVDWLSERWIKPIERTLAGVVGQGMGVEFVAGET